MTATDAAALPREALVVELHSDVPIDHVEHTLAVAGPGHVGFGPDYIDYAEAIVQVALKASGLGYGPPQPFPAGIARIEEVGNLTAGLLRRGHAPDVIRGVLGEAHLGVLDAVQA